MLIKCTYNHRNTQIQHSRVLIHCTQGISRSATLAIYYLMRAQHWSLVTSVNYCISNRGVCFPNQGFLQALMVEERQLYLANSLAAHELDQLLENTLPNRPVPKPLLNMGTCSEKPECCHICTKFFSILDWRHRCGLCKTIVCGKCSNSRLVLNQDIVGVGRSEVDRVCDSCVAHLWIINLPSPFRLNFRILLNGVLARKYILVKSPSLHQQTLTVTYFPGTETQLLMDVLRKRFQVRKYEILDVTYDQEGCDADWSLQEDMYLNLPDHAVLFAAIGESGSISEPRCSSFKQSSQQFLSPGRRLVNTKHSDESQPLPDMSPFSLSRSLSFSDGGYLAILEAKSDTKCRGNKDLILHHSIPGSRKRESGAQPQKTRNDEPVEGTVNGHFTM
jgi:hypothetical protein